MMTDNESKSLVYYGAAFAIVDGAVTCDAEVEAISDLFQEEEDKVRDTLKEYMGVVRKRLASSLI